MDDRQFEALLASMSQLSQAIRSVTNAIEAEASELRSELTIFRNSFELANDLETDQEFTDRLGRMIGKGESVFEDLDSPVGGDGE
jgi:hypothetical protein